MWAAGEPPVENFGGMSIAEDGASEEDGSAMPQQMHQQQQQQMPPQQMHQQYQQDPGGYGQQQPDGSCSYAGGAYGHPGGEMGYGDPSGGWGMGMGMGMGMGEVDDDYGDGHPMPQSMIEGPSVLIPALSFRQPFASLVLYGIKQLEARNRPTLKQMQGPLALHVSHREEPWNSPLLSAAVSLLRRRYPDEQINQFFQLPQTMAQGHGCIVGIVDVECTWHADLFNEVEQHQLTEQAVFPVQGAWVTQLRNPRWRSIMWRVPVLAVPQLTALAPAGVGSLGAGLRCALRGEPLNHPGPNGRLRCRHAVRPGPPIRAAVLLLGLKHPQP